MNTWMLPLAWIGLALFAPCTAWAQPVAYRLDPDHSFVSFEVLHFNTSTARGRFGPVAGQVMLDRSARRGEVSLRVATAGVSTGIPVFDARLRQADLLACDEYPEAYFVASQFSFDGDRVAAVRGEFTLRGTSQPLTLRALAFACRSEPARDGAAPAGPAREVCGGDFEGEFNRSDFGATFGLPFIADRVRLVVQVEAVRQ
jgi:polyisoprenoid-binding protein YceI